MATFRLQVSLKGGEEFPFEVAARNCLALWKTACWQFTLSFLHATMSCLKTTEVKLHQMPCSHSFALAPELLSC